jgi:hypothetical protein
MTASMVLVTYYAEEGSESEERVHLLSALADPCPQRVSH